MITEFTVSNYRSIGPDVRLKLGKLSVLIGPNGSGKSNVLDVLSFVRDAVLQGLPAAVIHRGGINSVRRRSQGRPYDLHVGLTVQHNGTRGTYGFIITGDRAEDYRVKAEWASTTTTGVTSQFQREDNILSGLGELAPRTDSQSLVLTALGGDERFKPLVDYLSRVVVYSIFPDTLRLPQKFDIERPMRCHGENWVSILRNIGEPDRKSVV